MPFLPEPADPSRILSGVLPQEALASRPIAISPEPTFLDQDPHDRVSDDAPEAAVY